MRDESRRKLFDLTAQFQEKMHLDRKQFNAELDSLKGEHITVMKTHRDDEAKTERDTKAMVYKYESQLKTLRESSVGELENIRKKFKEAEEANAAAQQAARARFDSSLEGEQVKLRISEGQVRETTEELSKTKRLLGESEISLEKSRIDSQRLTREMKDIAANYTEIMQVNNFLISKTRL